MTYADQPPEQFTGTGPLPLTTSFQGFRSDPVPFTTDPAVRGRCMIQAIRRYLRSRTRLGRLVNRLLGVKAVSAPPKPHLLQLSADQSDPKPRDKPWA